MRHELDNFCVNQVSNFKALKDKKIIKKYLDLYYKSIVVSICNAISKSNRTFKFKYKMIIHYNTHPYHRRPSRRRLLRFILFLLYKNRSIHTPPRPPLTEMLQLFFFFVMENMFFLYIFDLRENIFAIFTEFF